MPTPHRLMPISTVPVNPVDMLRWTCCVKWRCSRHRIMALVCFGTLHRHRRNHTASRSQAADRHGSISQSGNNQHEAKNESHDGSVCR